MCGSESAFYQIMGGGIIRKLIGGCERERTKRDIQTGRRKRKRETYRQVDEREREREKEREGHTYR